MSSVLLMLAILCDFVFVYRPPNSDMTCSVALINALESQIVPTACNKPVIIMGDFNLTELDWSFPCTVVDHTLQLISNYYCSLNSLV